MFGIVCRLQKAVIVLTGEQTVPQRKSGIKALRVTKKRRLHNLDIKTDLKKTIKNFQQLVTDKKIDEARAALKLVYKKVDKAAKRNIIHKNTAARRKSHFSKLLQTITK